jgi:diguanylate cyclase (GGDEF)-like protein/PAS domain S-box-containing protein
MENRAMRKLIISNLLLIMFLVGAASGFFVSNVGWWGLYRGAQDLDKLHDAGSASLKQIYDFEKNALHVQTLFLDVLKKQKISNADEALLARADAEVKQQLAKLLQQDKKHADYWNEVATFNARLAISRAHTLQLLAQDPERATRFYITDTQPLFEQMSLEVHQSLPSIIQQGELLYTRAIDDNTIARNLLLGMSLLATMFFCATAWLTYRETMERRRKTAELDQEHTLFKTLFESTNDGIILFDSNRLIDCNRSALRMFAVPTLPAFLGLDFSRLQPSEQPDGGVSADGLRRRIEDTVQHGSQHFEWQFKSFDGVEFPAEVAIDVAHLGDKSTIQISIRDITRRKQTENSMRLANQAFENSLEGMVITDEHCDILTVNHAFTAITGYLREEVTGRNPRILSSGRQTAEFYEEMWRELREAGKWQGEIWNIRKNGDIYPQWLNISRVIDDHGKVVNFVGVFSDISERKSAEERILHQVYYDQLTDLPNRILFNDRLSQVLGMAKRHPENSFAVMFVDLDRFKLINDSMGHDAGDQLLQQAAHRLHGSVRETDTVARMGGDEFTIVLSKVRNGKDAAGVAQKILDSFRAPFMLDGQEVYISLSIGISVYPEDGKTVDVLLKNADMAMYRAKSAGGSWYELWDEALSTQATQRLAIESALHKAVERDELELHYQPQYDCETHTLTGFEALLRWRHPERGLLYPDSFIQIAEETGLIVPIGEWVLQTACAQAQEWRALVPGHRMIAVNLSGRQFQYSDIVKQVKLALDRSGLPHSCLELEITESVIMQDIDASVETMHQLADLGVQFSIDDFGTGYSSLAYLKRLPIHALKIDRSFIRDIVTGHDDAAIVSAIVAMSNKLGLRVVAEGIEDTDQLEHLRMHKGIVGQGFLLGRPAPAALITRQLAEGFPEVAAA